MGVKSGLPPVARPDATLLILGSLPGDASLASQRYYAHPTNQFWRLLGTVIGEDLNDLDYDARLARLVERTIGLWDVVASASRKGSLDQAIREAEHNRIDHLIRDLGNLRAIAFNGSTAASIGRTLIGHSSTGIKLVDLPSSSAANTMSFAVKAALWSRLKEFVSP